MVDKPIVLIGIPIPTQQKIPSHLERALKNLRGNFEVIFERDLPGEDFKGDRIFRIAKARERIRERFLSGNYTHLLFIDSDMDFPPETLNVLLSIKADLVYHSYLWHPETLIKGQDPIISHGLGCTLISRKVLEKCDFLSGMKEEGNEGVMGEDALFRQKIGNQFTIQVLDNRLQLRHLAYDSNYFWEIFKNRKQDREAMFGGTNSNS